MSAIAYSGLPPQRLELEITESVLLGETEANMAILHCARLARASRWTISALAIRA
jgi:EAL domain-containing protein (putative c-di-GMP-specific phosphodiesterase class I)